jgi:hypothetical protein
VTGYYLNEILQAQNLLSLLFVAADDDLLSAAEAEQFPVDNPLDHLDHP